MSSNPQFMPNTGYASSPYGAAMLQYLAQPQKWNTPLPQNQVQPYQQWQMQNAPMGDILQGDEADYDYQGAFLAGLQRNLAGGQHFTDAFKKPNHPTFSNESFNPLGFPAGRWEGEQFNGPSINIPQRPTYGFDRNGMPKSHFGDGPMLM